jgi:metal-responsive CopG/Arc/MetJ family transcriptional regulator
MRELPHGIPHQPPDLLLEEFDDFVKRHYGGNRTEGVREAMRRLIKEEEKQ